MGKRRKGYKEGGKHKGGIGGWVNSNYINRDRDQYNYYYVECEKGLNIQLRMKPSQTSRFFRIVVSNKTRVFIKETKIHKGNKWFYIEKL